LYACPEDLYPKEACDQGKRDRREAGLKFVQTKPVQVHPMKEYRRVPLLQLRRRLQVEEYEKETPFSHVDLRPSVVRIKMRQHTGAAAAPAVSVGDRVKQGQVVGRVEESKLGVNVHSSIAGKVRAATPEFVEVVA
jgi:biotin carboxyl carrier protein